MRISRQVTDKEVPTNPMRMYNVNIFYFSLSFGLLKDLNFYYNEED